MNLMSGLAGLAGFGQSFADASSRADMRELHKQQLQMQLAAQQQEQAMRQRQMAQEQTDRMAFAKRVDPAAFVESYGDMGSRPASVGQLPSIGVQKELRDMGASENSSMLQRNALAWFFGGGEEKDPGGKAFAQRFSASPYEYLPQQVLTAAENRKNQRLMQQERLDNLRAIASLRSGGSENVGTWSVTPNGAGMMNNKTGEIRPLPDDYKGQRPGMQISVFGREFEKKAAQDYFKLQSAAEKAQQSLAGLDAAESAINKGIYTGPGGDAVQMGRKVLGAVGLADTDTVASAEEITKLQNEMALIIRNPDSGMGLPGAASDRDVEFLKSMQIGLDKSPEANRRFIEAARKIKQRQIEVAEMASEYINQNGTLDQNFYALIRDYANKNPMFGQVGQATQSGGGGWSDSGLPDGFMELP